MYHESEGLTKLMGPIGTEGRKERLGSIYAFHHWNKLQPSLQENLQGGVYSNFFLEMTIQKHSIYLNIDSKIQFH